MATTLDDLTAATSLAKANKAIVRQSTTDLSMTLDLLAQFIVQESDQGFAYDAISSDTTVTSIEQQQTLYEVDTTAADVNLTLPFSGPRDGAVVIVRNISGSNDVIVTYQSGVTVTIPAGKWAMFLFQSGWNMLLNTAGEAVSGLNSDQVDGKDVQTTMTYSNSYIPTSKAILDFLFPVGDIYVQYPVAESNTETTAFPTAFRPATKFGGTWSELYDDENVFFRTKGTDGQLRTNGLSPDQMQKITGSILGLWTTGPTATGAFKVSAAGSGRPNTGGDGCNTYSFDSVNSPNARTSATTDGFTEPRNRLYKIWIRTA